MTEPELDAWGEPIKEKRARRLVECRHCTGYPNWADQKRAFGYMVDAGVPVEDIKKMQPLCQDCAALFREMIGLTRHPRKRLYPRRRS